MIELDIWEKYVTCLLPAFSALIMDLRASAKTLIRTISSGEYLHKKINFTVQHPFTPYLLSNSKIIIIKYISSIFIRYSLNFIYLISILGR